MNVHRFLQYIHETATYHLPFSLPDIAASFTFSRTNGLDEIPRYRNNPFTISTWSSRNGIAEFAGLEFAGLENDGLENDVYTGVEQEQTYAFKVKPVLFEGTV